MKKKIIFILGAFFEIFHNIFKSYKREQIAKKCKIIGVNSDIAYPYNIAGAQNIYIGSNVHIGSNSTIFSTLANLHIHDHVITGPNIKIFTGDHMSIPGKYITQVSDEMKDESYDQDVIIESDCWLGAGCIILKGVTIGRGSIISAGAIVLKNVEPYSIVAGIPGKVIKKRFTNDQILFHERKLNILI